jgi:arylsulfatase A-like enzyme
MPMATVARQADTDVGGRIRSTDLEALQADAPRPNIVIVMIDDIPLVKDSFFAKDPNITDLFINHGISFRNMNGNDPLCCPGTWNTVSGQNSKLSGVVRNYAPLADPRETIATELQGTGYYTVWAGKYLNKFEAVKNHFPPGYDHFAAHSGGYYNYDYWVDGVYGHNGREPQDYSTDFFARKAMEFLREAPADKPVFLMARQFAPHTNLGDAHLQALPSPVYKNDPKCDATPRYNPANFNERDVTDKPAWIRKRSMLSGYYTGGFPIVNHCKAMLSVDDEVGQIVSELKAQGRFDNTLFILMGDNGMGWGSHRWLRKSVSFATGIPFYVSWPAVITNVPAVNSSQLVNVDIAPTLCELAGCTMGPYPNGFGVSGQSFAGLLDPSFTSSTPNRIGILSNHISGSGFPAWRSIRTSSTNPLGNWKFTFYPSTGEKELYDTSGGPCIYWQVGMPGDPCELKNLAYKRKYRDTVRQLKLQLNDLYVSPGTYNN